MCTYVATVLLLISILAFDQFGSSSPTSYITNGGSGGRERQLINQRARPAARKYLRRVFIISLPIFNPATQESSSRLSQDDIARIMAAVGVHFQLQTLRETLSSSHQANLIFSSAGVSTIAVPSSATITISNFE